MTETDRMTGLEERVAALEARFEELVAAHHTLGDWVADIAAGAGGGGA